MIKSLLDADENPPPDTKVVVEETIVEPPPAPPSVAQAAADENIFSPEQLKDVDDILEIPASPVFAAPSDAAQTNSETVSTTPTNNVVNSQPSAGIFGVPFVESNENRRTDTPIFQAAFEPESQAETMRKSGLAYAAALTLFGAVVFMMILGWGFDLLFGSSPWGIVGGIVVGALIGFVQFFRLSSQIFK